MSPLDNSYSSPGTAGGIPYGDIFSSSFESLPEPYSLLTPQTNMIVHHSARASVHDRILALKRQKQLGSDPLIDPDLSNTDPDIHSRGHGDKHTRSESDDDESGLGDHIHPSDTKQLLASLKTTKRFKPESSTDLDTFASSDAQMQRLLTAAWLLQICDLLATGSASTAPYKISSDLQTDLKKYSYCIMLSPFLTSYQQSVPAKAMLAAMHELSISMLPPEKEAHKMKIVHSAVATHLTNARNLIKTEISRTLKEDCPHSNSHIAALSHAIISKSRSEMSVTAHIQMRFAFLASLTAAFRTALRDSEAAPDKTWPTVDGMLPAWELMYPGKEALVDQMKMNLLVDQEDFKRPQDENVIYPTTATKDLEQWQKICDRHTGRVELDLKAMGRGELSHAYHHHQNFQTHTKHARTFFSVS
ncbi:hypothetical protein JB92DRAFT_3138395 [Gautieria morchelliformis]|nr:hypothetical protein JB92DRAFT_3138395 [Gautieria morchelliformis]